MITKTKSLLFAAVTVGLTSVFSVIGGIGLETVSSKIIPLIPLLIAVPALNTLVGDYASIIASHFGDTHERKKTKKEVYRSILKVIVFNILAIILFSSIIAISRGYILHQDFLIKFIIFIVVSVWLIIIFMFAINKLLDKILKKTSIFPDDVLIPVSTGMADLLMLTLITFSVLFIF